MDNSNGKRKFLIATHGTLALGIKSSLNMIIGSVEHLFLILAYLDQNVSVETEIKQVLEQIEDRDELVVFTDILGGSVTNQILQHSLKSNIYIISGFNLPLIIDVILADNSSPIEEVISASIENAKEQMVYVNKLLTGQNRETGHD
jgi:fructoselysine and glucoselysine-specific PTS system IIA component